MSSLLSRSTALNPIDSGIHQRDSARKYPLPNQIWAELCVNILLAVCVILPAIPFSDSFPYVRVEQVLLPVILGIYLWLLFTGHVRLIRLNGLAIVAVIFSFCVLFSLWYGSAVLGHTIVLRDYYELLQAWLPVAFFTIAYEADLTEKSLRRLLPIFGVVVLLSCIYAWAQFANLEFTYALNPYYSAGTHIDRALRAGGRVYATMGNPNVLAQLMTWSVAAFSMAAIFQVGNWPRNIIITLACLATLAMTGSRFGLLTAALVLLLILVLPAPPHRNPSIRIVLLLFIIPVFAWTFQAVAKTNKPTMQRFETLKHPLEIDSFRARIDDAWRDAQNDFSRSPIVGHGPAKSIFSGIVTDSEYWDILKEFGILGFLCYLAYYIFPLSLMWKGLRAGILGGPIFEDRLPATFLVLRLGIIMVITALIMNTGMTTFHNHLLQGFLWMWMGLAARSAATVSKSLTAVKLSAIARRIQ